jgi:hypothetical protein
MKPLQGIPQMGVPEKVSLCVHTFSEISLSMEEKTGRRARLYTSL